MVTWTSEQDGFLTVKVFDETTNVGGQVVLSKQELEKYHYLQKQQTELLTHKVTTAVEKLKNGNK